LKNNRCQSVCLIDHGRLVQRLSRPFPLALARPVSNWRGMTAPAAASDHASAGSFALMKYDGVGVCRRRSR
jgi:hypothetical protein